MITGKQKIIVILIISLFLAKCEKDEIKKINGKSNKLEFTQVVVQEVSYREATLRYEVINLDKNNVNVLGLCYNTTEQPNKNNNPLQHEIKSSGYQTIKNLNPNTTYYFKYFIELDDFIFYSNQQAFTTKALGTPTISTKEISEITAVSVKSGGNIPDNGGTEVTSRGICWNTNGNPTITDNKTTDGAGTGSFTSTITNLQPGTKYYVRSYATNSAGTVYGNEFTFISGVTLPEISTDSITNIEGNSASGGGNISNAGGGSISEKGICWSKSVNPTIEDNKTNDGIGDGAFTSNLTGLEPGTKYYVLAYATNESGTSYGNQVSFTSSVILPTITTSEIIDITGTSAQGGGNVANDGGGNVTARGICWNTTGKPTITDNKTTDDTGTGSFTSQLTGLDAETYYYVRAYATNEYGTVYGNEILFTNKTSGTFIDSRDGKTYKWVKIGDQNWMAENLAATKYNDGTAIPNVRYNKEWANLSTPAYCWYDNDEASYKDTYGALYNWYAVETGKLCPDGWHVPTDDEWKELEIFLGMSQNDADDTGFRGTGEGKKFKAKSGWISGGNGTDDFGFAAVPGGYRYSGNGNFYYIGGNGTWWSSNEYNTNDVWYRRLIYDNSNVLRNHSYKQNGFSVRCLRD